MFIGPVDNTDLDLETGRTRTDLRSSQLTPRLAEDGDHVRSYSPVIHDQPVREFPAKDSKGTVFGTNVLPESISVSPDNARWYLAMVYGTDQAEAMIGRALATGQVINGRLMEVADSQARTRGKLSVATDKSRPGMLTLIPHVLRQSGGKKR